MAELTAWTIDHRRAAVALRERAAIPADAVPVLAAEIARLPGCGEAVVIATCNRLEIHAAGTLHAAAIASAVAVHCRSGADELAAAAALLRGEAAVAHLFRVVSGLESMVLGEAEIAGQAKRAYELAHGAGATGAVLNPLFQRAFHVGKEVRSTTAVGAAKRSVASVAVEFIRQVHDDPARAPLLVVGAGETAELAITHLRAAGVRSISICNRSPERAAGLAAQVGATVLPWATLATALAEHDIVVSSTASSEPVITHGMVAQAMRRRRRPLVLVDLAVPRDVEPAAAALDDVFVFDLDRLEQVVVRNQGLREADLEPARRIIDRAVAAWTAETAPGQAELLAGLAGFFKGVGAGEAARLAERLGIPEGDPRRDELRYAFDRMGAKLLHPLLQSARDHGDEPAVREALAPLLRAH